METNGMGVDIPARPYELDVRADSTAIINELDEMTLGGTNIDAAAISRLASGILVPSTKTRDTRIDGGWSGKRIIFSMVVAVMERDTYREVRYVSGYTDRVDYSVDSHGKATFPNDLRLYFNSVAKISLMEVANRDMRAIRPTIMDNDLILNNRSIVKDPRLDDSFGREKPLLLRPSDILLRQSSSNHMSGILGKALTGNSVNTVGHFNLSLQASKRRNNNSAEHMSQTIKNYIGARSSIEDNGVTSIHGSHDDNEDYLGKAATRSRETVLMNDPFLHELNALSGLVNDGFVDWGDLMRLDPDFKRHGDHVFITWNSQVKASNRSRNERGEHTRGVDKYHDTSSFYENTVESTCALMIVQSLPELLSNAMYAGVQGLVINSHPQRNEPAVHLAMAIPFMDGIPVKQGYNYFTSQIENVVIPNVTKNKTFHIEAMVNANIDTDIEIWISVDSGPEEYFAWPSWAEAVAPPVVTDDIRDLESISEKVAGIVEDFAIHVEADRPRVMRKTSLEETFSASPRIDLGYDEPRQSRKDIDLGF